MSDSAAGLSQRDRAIEEPAHRSAVWGLCSASTNASPHLRASFPARMCRYGWFMRRASFPGREGCTRTMTAMTGPTMPCVLPFSRMWRRKSPLGRLLDWRPDVVHANDWHAGLVPLLLSIGKGCAGPPPSSPSTIWPFRGISREMSCRPSAFRSTSSRRRVSSSMARFPFSKPPSATATRSRR